MSMINDKQQQIENWFSAAETIVNISPASLFTKDDVIRMFNTLKNNMMGGVTAGQFEEKVETSSKIKLTKDQRETLTGKIIEAFQDGNALEFIADYDLSINYREVELDSIDWDTSNLESAIDSSIKEWIEENNDDDDCDC